MPDQIQPSPDLATQPCPIPWCVTHGADGTHQGDPFAHLADNELGDHGAALVQAPDASAPSIVINDRRRDLRPVTLDGAQVLIAVLLRLVNQANQARQGGES